MGAIYDFSIPAAVSLAIPAQLAIQPIVIAAHSVKASAAKGRATH
jgi:hypothetical protein